MAESRTTWANLLAQYADNTAGAITAEDLRDFVMSSRPFVTTTAPTASSDSTLGFDFGHAWLDTTGPTLFACIDATAAAAVWVQVYPQTGGGELTDLASTGASVGQVPKADGAGGIAWAAESGGGGASAFTDLADTPGSYAGQGGKLVAVNAGATALEFVTGGGGGGNDYYDLQLGFVGAPDAGATDIVLSARAVTIDDADPGEVYVRVNPTSAATIAIHKNGVSVGSISITTGGVASWTVAADIVLARGDLLALVAPTPADSTLADVLVAFRGVAP